MGKLNLVDLAGSERVSKTGMDFADPTMIFFGLSASTKRALLTEAFCRRARRSPAG